MAAMNLQVQVSGTVVLPCLRCCIYVHTDTNLLPLLCLQPFCACLPGN
jgi:hypothetical protein